MKFSMNLNTKGKNNLMADRCADTSFSSIVNFVVRVLQTGLRITMVGFDDDLSNKSIIIRADTTAVDLPNNNHI